MIDIVNALITRDRELLLVKRNPERRLHPDTWSFPGGHVEPGETLEAALIREVGEELAITPTAFTFFTTLREPSFTDDGMLIYHFYRVTEWAAGEPVLTGSEHTEMQWLSPEQAAARDGLALPEYRSIFAKLGTYAGAG